MRPSAANILCMAHSFLIFDFGGDEEAAQQARHRIDGWKQGFRLDKKIQVKFERKEPDGSAPGESASKEKMPKSAKRGKVKAGAKAKSGNDAEKEPDSSTAGAAHIRLIVRLDFSEHEKLSHQRWVERIPTEEPFKTASPQILRGGDPEFQATSVLFDSLD